MNETFLKSLTVCIILSMAAFVYLPATFPGEVSKTPPSNPPKAQADLGRRIEEITDAVLTYHIDPPARQQMFLDGVKALYQTSGVPAPVGLSQRVSALTAPGQFAAFLTEIWPRTTPKPVAVSALEQAMIEGTLVVVPGGASVMSAKESAVLEQFEGNRYVGIHIALGMNEEEKRPSIFDVIDGGPADRAGVKKGDLLELIDGVDTKAMALRAAIDLLRGQEGSSVTIKVRQPNAAIARTYTIRRGQHARSTVLGLRKRPGGDWDCLLDATAPIAYLRIEQITSSTPHDLRKLARQLEGHGHCGIILDLRSVEGVSVHPAVLLADTLLPAGVIGRVRTAQREVTYQSNADALFRGLPIAVLVNQFTAGTAEWVVAALQDNHRAMIVGSPTFSAMIATPGISRRSDVKSRVSVGDGSWSIELVTGYLERSDGRRLSSDITNASASSSIALQKPKNRSEVTVGVKPDYPVGTARGRAETAVPPQAPQTLDQKPNLANDPVVQEAVRLLRRSLEKFI